MPEKKILIYDMKNNKIIKIVTRAGGLVETNSSSSHALSICSKQDSMVKPGDPDFDLDIRDGVLYVSCRSDDFGWEYEKSNSCLTKLQYTCGLFFNSWESLHRQKKPQKLKVLLKNYLGVSDVVFEWEEEYKKFYGERDGCRDEAYLNCPEIDHNSRSESMEEILETDNTIINFIFNRNSWYFGGNDNSDAPYGFYREMSMSGSDCVFDQKVESNATISMYFGGKLGRVDFRVNMYDVNKDSRGRHIDSPGLLSLIEDSDGLELLRNITYNPDTSEFIVSDSYRTSIEWSADMDIVMPDGKCYAVFLNREGQNEMMEIIRIRLQNKNSSDISTSEILSAIPEEHRKLVLMSLVSDEFGEIYVP